MIPYQTIYHRLVVRKVPDDTTCFLYMSRAEALAHIDVQIRTIFVFNRILMCIILNSEVSSKYDVRISEIEVVLETRFKTTW
jgi:hypothetical protein